MFIILIHVFTQFFNRNEKTLIGNLAYILLLNDMIKSYRELVGFKVYIFIQQKGLYTFHTH